MHEQTDDLIPVLAQDEFLADDRLLALTPHRNIVDLACHLVSMYSEHGLDSDATLNATCELGVSFMTWASSPPGRTFIRRWMSRTIRLHGGGALTILHVKTLEFIFATSRGTRRGLARHLDDK